MMSYSRRIDVVRVVLALAAWGFCGAGCTQQEPAGSPLQTAWETPQPAAAETRTPAEAGPAANATQPATPADGGARPLAAATDTQPSAEALRAEALDAIAFVNGEPIGRQRLVDMLIESRGIAVLEQMILLTAAKQKAASMSVGVTAEDITAAEDDALRRISSPMGGTETAPLDRPTAERLLAEFLKLKGLSTVEWKCRMEQLAYLSKIAQAEVARMDITDQMLKDEYNLAYGERVQVRHIQASTQDVINRAAEMLKTKPFEQVAREVSENSVTREQGGLMPPFTRHDGAVPPLVRERAFAMKVGEVSEPLREGAYYQIIRVERTFPASSVGFENVDRDKLRQRLVDRLVRQRTDALDAELFQAARIDIRDRALSRQFRERHQPTK